jgi:hypothetical protein
MSAPECEYSESRAEPMDRQESVHLTKRDALIDQLEQMTPDPLVAGDWQEVALLVPVDLEVSARESQALLRRRGVGSAEALLRMALAYALCDWSLQMVAAWAYLQGWAVLSATGLMYRLRGARRWLGELVAAVVITNRSDLASYPVRVRLIDASVINGPGSKGTDFRLHLSLDLGQGRFDEVEVTDSKGGETLIRHAVQRGDILLVDRGYAHAKGIGRVLAQGAELVVRISLHNMRLYDEGGVKLDLLEWLRSAPDLGPVERQVWIQTPDGTFPVRLMAKRLCQEAAEAARRRLRRQASKNGRTPDERSLELAGFITLMSNLGEPVWTAGQVMALYRLRWQVEMAFKRLKGVLALDHLRAQDPDLAQSYLLSKLLGALMVDRMSHGPAVSIDWFESLERPVSPWRWLVLWSDALRRAVQGTIRLEDLIGVLPRLQRYLCDAPRRRKQHYALSRRLMQLLIALTDTSHVHTARADQLLQPTALS